LYAPALRLTMKYGVRPHLPSRGPSIVHTAVCLAIFRMPHADPARKNLSILGPPLLREDNRRQVFTSAPIRMIYARLAIANTGARRDPQCVPKLFPQFGLSAQNSCQHRPASHPLNPGKGENVKRREGKKEQNGENKEGTEKLGASFLPRDRRRSKVKALAFPDHVTAEARILHC